MAKFVNPFVDMAFKRIFGREESKRLMIDFLNAVIGDKNPVLVDLENAATRLGMTFDEEVAYQRALKRMWDYDAVMEGEREYARAKGLEEGLEQGLAEGREKGLAEGREEERLSMAMSLKSLGVDVETIAKASGLSIEKIESL